MLWQSSGCRRVAKMLWDIRQHGQEAGTGQASIVEGGCEAGGHELLNGEVLTPREIEFQRYLANGLKAT
jgi:hypothetical protein